MITLWYANRHYPHCQSLALYIFQVTAVIFKVIGEKQILYIFRLPLVILE